VCKDRKGDFKKRFLMFLITVVSVAGIARIAVAASQVAILEHSTGY
jgi:hypothetical protein